jgi:putative transposase
LKREHCHLHAYVLMTNHVHLLLTPEHATAVPRLIISVGRNIRIKDSERIGDPTGVFQIRRRKSSAT